jgi:hypothetical protein
MSEYRVLWPDEVANDLSDAEPVILQFHVEPFRAGAAMNVIQRARLIYDNRTCRTCGYPVVTPIELNDAQLNRNLRPVHGTATLVGFRCHGCRAEWSV